MTPALAINEVERSALGDKRVGAEAHAGERRQIELNELQSAAVRSVGADLLCRGLSLGQIARGADHLGSVSSERSGRLYAETS
jgi:hypothetical protein